MNIGAYILSDRSTWISFGNKKNHTIIVENVVVIKYLVRDQVIYVVVQMKLMMRVVSVLVIITIQW